MDATFVIPGTNIRMGLDAIIGLVPGVGDVISGVISRTKPTPAAIPVA